MEAHDEPQSCLTAPVLTHDHVTDERQMRFPGGNEPHRPYIPVLIKNAGV